MENSVNRAEPTTARSHDDFHRSALDFLQRDFDQAFSEKRRLEDQIWDICKFSFSSESLLVGAAIATHQYSLEKSVDFGSLGVVLLSLTLLVGAFALLLLVRTRVYFVIVCRFINGQRRMYAMALELLPLVQLGYYDDPTKPPYFSWSSTQIWASFLVATLNASVAAAIALVSFRPGRWQLIASAASFAVSVILQIALIRLYLSRLENKNI